MKDKDKLIIAIVAVLAIIVAVGGATYAYWSWVSDTANQTSVNFTVIGGSNDINAKINGNGTTTITKLIPTASCTSSNALVKAVDITYLNNTTSKARITANLKVTNFTASSAGTPTAANLTHLKWSITKTQSLCTDDSSENYVAGGDFSGSTGNPNLLSATGSTKIDVATITNEIAANVTTETSIPTYYLHVWLDSEYEHTNVGNVNNDPMQNISFTLEWSGTIEQIAG